MTFFRTISIGFICMIVSVIGFAQTIRGKVIDSETQQPLPFCHIQNNTSNQVSLTNEDGTFQIQVVSTDDTLLFSYLGYEALMLTAKQVTENPTVVISSSSIKVNEMVVTTDDYLYDLVARTRKNLLKTKLKPAKTYLQVETNLKNNPNPLEMIQGYYNTTFSGMRIDDIELKSGRVALAKVDSTAFVNLGTTQALAKLDLVYKNGSYLENPFQFNLRKLKKNFKLQKIATTDNGKVLQIAYTAKNEAEGFNGEMWIHEPTGTLMKVILKREKAKRHPFFPLHSDSKIEEVNLEITQNFQRDGAKNYLSHINLKYNVVFLRNLPEGFRRLELEAEGILHFYNRSELFVLPYYDFDYDFNDYRKISLVPYNPVFWENNEGLVMSEAEKKKLAFFNEEGFLLNFAEKFLNDKPFFEFNNIFWSPSKRIQVKSLPEPPENSSPLNPNARVVNSRLEENYILANTFAIQIYLDINRIKDSLHYQSATILDIFKTRTNYENNNLSKCVINILFDLHEIERRKMMTELKSRDFTFKQADIVYQRTKSKMEELQKTYLKEVNKGENMENLKKWNDMVKAELGIDNIELFLSAEEK